MHKYLLSTTFHNKKKPDYELRLLKLMLLAFLLLLMNDYSCSIILGWADSHMAR